MEKMSVQEMCKTPFTTTIDEIIKAGHKCISKEPDYVLLDLMAPNTPLSKLVHNIGGEMSIIKFPGLTLTSDKGDVTIPGESDKSEDENKSRNIDDNLNLSFLELTELAAEAAYEYKDEVNPLEFLEVCSMFITHIILHNKEEE